MYHNVANGYVSVDITGLVGHPCRSGEEADGVWCNKAAEAFHGSTGIRATRAASNPTTHRILAPGDPNMFYGGDRRHVVTAGP